MTSWFTKVEFESFEKKPEISELQTRYPEISDLLYGEFSDNSCDEIGDGQGISYWVLNQGKDERNPTLERISVGSYAFTCPYEVKLTILNGAVKVEIGDELSLITDKIRSQDRTDLDMPKSKIIEGRTLIIPPNTKANIYANWTPLICFFEYR